MVNTPSNIKVQNLLDVDKFVRNFKVQISWDASTESGIQSYKVYRNWVPYGTFRLVKTITHPDTSYIDSPPLDTVPLGFVTGIDGEWWYKVSAVVSGVESIVSSPFTYEKSDAFDISPFSDLSIDGLCVGYTATHADIYDYPDNEEMSYYFGEIRRRKLWLVQQDGEDIYLVKRKVEGDKCPYWQDDARQCEYPLGSPEGEDACYGTGIIGGYHPSVLIKARIVPAMQGVQLIDAGMRIAFTPRSWTIWTPRVANWDFLVRRDGRRLEITNVQRQNFRGLITHQLFDVTERPPSPTDLIYRVPISTPMPW